MKKEPIIVFHCCCLIDAVSVKMPIRSGSFPSGGRWVQLPAQGSLPLCPALPITGRTNGHLGNVTVNGLKLTPHSDGNQGSTTLTTVVQTTK